MQDLYGQQALPLPKDDSFPNQAEDPQQICKSLKIQVLNFVADIEQLLDEPLLVSHRDFLDRIASHLVTLQSLIVSTRICSEATQEISVLIDNILRCNVLVKGHEFALSMLDAAKIYRKNKNHVTPLALILQSYLSHKRNVTCLLDELKLLASDLIEEKENI